MKGQQIGKNTYLAPGEIPTGLAAELAGMDPATLRRWVLRGGLKPRKHGTGRGAIYGWTVRDIVAARALRQLRERVSAQAARRVVAELKRHGEDLASAVLVLDAHGVYQVLETGDLAGLLDGGQIRAVALAPIVKEIKARARKAGYG